MTLYKCDKCGKLSESIIFHISIDGFDNQINIDLCDECKDKLYIRIDKLLGSK